MDILIVLVVTVGVIIVTAIAAGAFIEAKKKSTGESPGESVEKQTAWLAGIDRLLDEVLELKSDQLWKPIDSCPSDEKVYLWHTDGDVHHIIMNDSLIQGDLKAQGYTHWRLRFPDPNQD